MARQETAPLRRGWTTGACAAAAARAAYEALLTGRFPDPVDDHACRAARRRASRWPARARATGARGGVVKDAGDDPDVTHGALIVAAVASRPSRHRRRFPRRRGRRHRHPPGPAAPGRRAGDQPGAARDDPRGDRRCRDAIGRAGDVVVTIAIPGGESLAEQDPNARLGIVGGLSILGTTGIVVPYSCASWIHSIHRGIDVARAAGLDHVAAATGTTSEAAVQRLLRLPEIALIDMGDFVGGTLKYLRAHPVPRADPGRRLRQARQARCRPPRPALEPQPGRRRRARRAAGRARRAAGTLVERRARRHSAGAGAGAGARRPACRWPTGGARGRARSRSRRSRATSRSRSRSFDRDGALLGRVGGPVGSRHDAPASADPRRHRRGGALAAAALARFGDAIDGHDLARRPHPHARRRSPGAVRIGGFGGAAGLAALSAEHAVDRLIDATHPFAAEISRTRAARRRARPACRA